MVAIAFTVNGKELSVEAEPDTPLLWVLREHLKLTGTKFGCGIAQCGACTVHLDGEPTRSCSVQMSNIRGQAGHDHRRSVTGLEPPAAEGLDYAE